ncbi:unnamed protein product, partial [Meganyctiphanes norvegica]
FTEMPSFVRLDETDAIFVDNYHTDGAKFVLFGYGTPQAMGNIDFYPNGGRNQPGCLFPVLHPCSHSRAIGLYRDTLKQGYHYIAHECTDYNSFKNGNCSTSSPIGIRADEYTQKERVNIKFYFDTNKEAPYCGCSDKAVITCTNKHEKCDIWKKMGNCEKKKTRKFMEKNCPKACNK